MNLQIFLQYLTWVNNALIYLLPLSLFVVFLSRSAFHLDVSQQHRVAINNLFQLDKKSVFILFLVFFGAMDRLISYAEPYETDQMVYALIASSMLDGELLYVDVWDHKPPATYWVYMAFIWVFGLNPLAIWVMGYVFFILAMLGCYVFASQLAGRKAGLIAATVWTLFNSDIFFQGNQPNTEVFMNTALIWGLVFFRKMIDSENPKYPIFAGILFFLATFFKMIAITVPILLGLFLIILNLTNLQQLKQKAIQLAWLAGVAAFLWLSVFLYYELAGMFDVFWEAVFVYNRFYAGNILENIFRIFSIQEFVFIIPYLLILAMIMVSTLFGGRYLFLLFVYLAGAIIAAALPGKLFFHYYQLLLPGMAVGVGVLVASAMQNKKWMLLVVIGIAMLIPASGRVMQMMVPGYLYPLYKYDRETGAGHLESKLMSDWLNESFSAEQTIFHWGVSPGVYFWSGRSCPTSVMISGHHLGDNPVVWKNTQRTLEELDVIKPDLIVTSDEWIFADLPVAQWILKNYKFTEGPEYIQVSKFMVPR